MGREVQMIRHCLSLIILLGIGIPTKAEELIEFDFEVLPTLTRAGCNSGSCHGAAVGRGGFHLSLWGSNPSEDYATIAHEFEGRRIDVRQPSDSLFLKKPTGTIDHEGGALLDERSIPWQILYDWVQQGAQRVRTRELDKLELQFNQRALDAVSAATLAVGEHGTLEVIAHFKGRKPLKINHLVTITIPDPSGLKFEPDTLELTALRPGIHTVTMRYCDRVQSLQILTPKPSTLPQTASAHSRQDANVNAESVIDRWLDERRTSLSESAVPPADEATLLRRVMLDLIGRAPTALELEVYLQDTTTDKYERQVEKWLTSTEYVDFWTYRWTRTFGLRPNSNAPQGLHQFYQWLHQQIASNRAWDEVTREMITATGDCHEEGPAFFMLLANDPRQQAEQISRWFIGSRMECANCHDHPLDRWKQDDYHGLAAVFARIERKQIVRWLDRGAVTNPRTGLPAIAQLPGGARFSSSGDVRAELAKWLIEHPDSLLAKSTVNRVWSHFFGRGLVEPVDDMRLTNPATHPQLLQALTAGFVSKRYDIRSLIREMVLSKAYRRQAPATTAESLSDITYNFGPRKAIPPDVLIDLIDDATGSSLPLTDKPSVQRAIQLEDPTTPSMTLDTLGRCARSDVCNTTSATSSLSLMLHWINGETLNERITDEKHWLKSTLKENLESEEMLDRMYLRTLCRYPSTEERNTYLPALEPLSAAERMSGWEDLFWALLSSKDFLDNR
jgi:hypothetical protein